MAWTVDDTHEVKIRGPLPELDNPHPWVEGVDFPSGWTVTDPTDCVEGWYKPGGERCYERGCSKRGETSDANGNIFAMSTARLVCSRNSYDILSDFPPGFDTVRTGFMGDESKEVYNRTRITTFIVFRKGLYCARVQTNALEKDRVQTLGRDFTNQLFSNMP